eukprot:gene1715-2891_t
MPDGELSEQAPMAFTMSAVKSKRGQGLLPYVGYHLSIKTVLSSYKSNLESIGIWTIERRFKDFVWLRRAMRQEFPAHIIPPLPGKSVGGQVDKIKHAFSSWGEEELDEGTLIAYRKQALGLFLNWIGRHAVLREHVCFRKFLTLVPQDFATFARRHRPRDSHLSSVEALKADVFAFTHDCPAVVQDGAFQFLCQTSSLATSIAWEYSVLRTHLQEIHKSIQMRLQVHADRDSPASQAHHLSDGVLMVLADVDSSVSRPLQACWCTPSHPDCASRRVQEQLRTVTQLEVLPPSLRDCTLGLIVDVSFLSKFALCIKEPAAYLAHLMYLRESVMQSKKSNADVCPGRPCPCAALGCRRLVLLFTLVRYNMPSLSETPVLCAVCCVHGLGPASSAPAQEKAEALLQEIETGVGDFKPNLLAHQDELFKFNTEKSLFVRRLLLTFAELCSTPSGMDKGTADEFWSLDDSIKQVLMDDPASYLPNMSPPPHLPSPTPTSSECSPPSTPPRQRLSRASRASGSRVLDSADDLTDPQYTAQPSSGFEGAGDSSLAGAQLDMDDSLTEPANLALDSTIDSIDQGALGPADPVQPAAAPSGAEPSNQCIGSDVSTDQVTDSVASAAADSPDQQVLLTLNSKMDPSHWDSDGDEYLPSPKNTEL